MRFTAKKSLSVILTVLLLAVSFAIYFTPQAHAGLLTSASVALSDPRPSQASTTYTVTYTFPSTTTIKCIDIIFADTTAHITLSTNPATTAPSGMTSTSATKSSISGGGLTAGSWTLYNTTNGILQYENSSGEASSATSITITTDGVTNPSAATFYAQIATYTGLSTHTCSGLADSSNVMALATTGGVTTTVTVDPTISFSVAGSSGAVNGGPTADGISTASSVAFGSVSAGGSATSAAQLLTISTNAAHGYTIYIKNSQLLTDSNNDTIAAQTCASSDCTTVANAQAFSGSSSVSALGFTTNSTNDTITSNNWVGLTTSNVQIDHSTSPANAATLSVEYKLQLKNTQQPGTYSNVITYTATPTY